jgi:hypothetical protein
MYHYKLSEEIKWALVSGLAVFMTEVLVGFRPEEVKNWETWAVVAVGALVRSLAAALLGAFGKAKMAPADPPRRVKRRKPRSERERPPLPPSEENDPAEWGVSRSRGERL